MENKGIYFHEDDYCQIEILPAQNESFCRRQMGLIQGVAQAHAAEGGAGFTELYVREENPISLEDQVLDRKALEAALSPLVPWHELVYTGYSSYREVCANTHAFAVNEQVALFYSLKESIVSNIWLLLNPYTASERLLASRMLEALSGLGELLLVDWSWGTALSLRDKAGIDAYLQEMTREEEGIDQIQ